jgi:hypothetical protein
VASDTKLGTPDTVPESREDWRAPHVLIALPISLETGPVPGVEYGVGGALGLRVASLRIEASVTDWLRTASATMGTRGPSGGQAGGSFQVLSGALDVCYGAHSPTFELGPCVELEAGVVEATGLGITRPTTADVPWVALGFGAIAAVNLGSSWALPLKADLVLPLLRRDYSVENIPSPVYRPGLAGVRATAEVEYRFR